MERKKNKIKKREVGDTKQSGKLVGELVERKEDRRREDEKGRWRSLARRLLAKKKKIKRREPCEMMKN